MVADISHELRTPLTVLSGKLEFTLEQNRPLEPEEVAVLYDEVIRLRGLVGELQDLSRLEAGHAMLDKTLIAFPAYFSDFQVLLEAEAESKLDKWINEKFGDKLSLRAQIFGGVVLILIGIEIFIKVFFNKLRKLFNFFAFLVFIFRSFI